MKKFISTILFGGLLGVPSYALYMLIAFGTFYYSHITGIIFGSLSLISLLFNILKK